MFSAFASFIVYCIYFQLSQWILFLNSDLQICVWFSVVLDTVIPIVYSSSSNVSLCSSSQILRMLKGYDAQNVLLLPPRAPGETLAPELLDFYKEQSSQEPKQGTVYSNKDGFNYDWYRIVYKTHLTWHMLTGFAFWQNFKWIL